MEHNCSLSELSENALQHPFELTVILFIRIA